jgi:hypothetical protein
MAKTQGADARKQVPGREECHKERNPQIQGIGCTGSAEEPFLVQWTSTGRDVALTAGQRGGAALAVRFRARRDRAVSTLQRNQYQ